MAVDELRRNAMMAHLLDALEEGREIGHYGRFVFAVVARHFLDRDELVSWLTKDPELDERGARGLVQQVEEKDYSPPRREKILEWQQEQDFSIVPDGDDPDAGNVYEDLRFPPEVYEHIAEYHREKAD